MSYFDLAAVDFAAMVQSYRDRYGDAWSPSIDTLFLIELILRSTGNMPSNVKINRDGEPQHDSDVRRDP